MKWRMPSSPHHMSSPDLILPHCSGPVKDGKEAAPQTTLSPSSPILRNQFPLCRDCRPFSIFPLGIAPNLGKETFRHPKRLRPTSKRLLGSPHTPPKLENPSRQREGFSCSLSNPPLLSSAPSAGVARAPCHHVILSWPRAATIRSTTSTKLWTSSSTIRWLWPTSSRSPTTAICTLQRSFLSLSDILNWKCSFLRGSVEQAVIRPKCFFGSDC